MLTDYVYFQTDLSLDYQDFARDLRFGLFLHRSKFCAIIEFVISMNLHTVISMVQFSNVPLILYKFRGTLYWIRARMI